MDTCKVYVKTNKKNVITRVESSEFLRDTTGWTEIDEGKGDKYRLAQNNYFSDAIVDENGIYNYKLVDGKPIPRTDEEKEPEVLHFNALMEIAKLKSKLKSTDYIAAKLAEGVATKEEYADKLAERAACRARINELETMINELEGEI